MSVFLCLCFVRLFYILVLHRGFQAEFSSLGISLLVNYIILKVNYLIANYYF